MRLVVIYFNANQAESFCYRYVIVNCGLRSQVEMLSPYVFCLIVQQCVARTRKPDCVCWVPHISWPCNLVVLSRCILSEWKTSLQLHTFSVLLSCWLLRTVLETSSAISNIPLLLCTFVMSSVSMPSCNFWAPAVYIYIRPIGTVIGSLLESACLAWCFRSFSESCILILL